MVIKHRRPKIEWQLHDSEQNSVFNTDCTHKYRKLGW